MKHEEYKKEGEIVVFMDGNGKIGILGEEISRNGKLLKEVFEEHNLFVLNESEKCAGKITRQCTTNDNEVSAIDFVVAEESVEKIVKSMVIDGKGLIKLSGKKSTDHNTIVVTMSMRGMVKTKMEKQTIWRLNAPEESWRKFPI